MEQTINVLNIRKMQGACHTNYGGRRRRNRRRTH